MFGAIDYGKPIGRPPTHSPQNMHDQLDQELYQQDILNTAQSPPFMPNNLQNILNTAQGPSSMQNLQPEPDAYSPRFERRVQPEPDMVHQPNHYARYVIEPVTFIGANKLPFDVGNVIKYVCRYDAKNGIEDLEKAKRYVEIVIERVKREARIDNGERAETVWSEII